MDELGFVVVARDIVARVVAPNNSGLPRLLTSTTMADLH